MKESIFGEFQYFIKRISAFRSGNVLPKGETIEDLEQRFRVQIERGLVIADPHAQEVAMEVLLSDLTEVQQKKHLIELRRTGKTNFSFIKRESKTLLSNRPLTTQQKKERALDIIHESLKAVGVTAQKQPLGVKMLMAEYELKDVDYDDPKDLKLLLVSTLKISGHAKKASPDKLAEAFNKILSKQ